MNIAQITPYFPPHVGGVENCVKEISERLSKKGHNVFVVTSNIGYDRSDQRNPDLNIIRLNSIEIAHTVIIFNLLRALFALPKNTILHVHIAQALIPEIVYLVAKARGMKLYSHYHLDVDSSGFFGFLLKPYKKFFLKNVLLNSNLIICLSNVHKKLLIKSYGINESKIIIVPNGYNEQFSSVRSKINSFGNQLLYVGRLSSQKNIERLILATEHINKDFELNIVGDGELKDKLIKLVKDKGLKNINFIGSKSGLSLKDYYLKSDILIAPSVNEGMSLVLLEAMASGLPIISSDILQNRELLGDNGIYVSTTDERKLGEVISSLIENKVKREDMSKSELKKSERYSWDNIVNQIERSYYK